MHVSGFDPGCDCCLDAFHNHSWQLLAASYNTTVCYCYVSQDDCAIYMYDFNSFLNLKICTEMHSVTGVNLDNRKSVLYAAVCAPVTSELKLAVLLQKDTQVGRSGSLTFVF